ncbi:MAG: Lrp/AsnC family transcriptional regulator [Mycobacterium sp.]
MTPHRREITHTLETDARTTDPPATDLELIDLLQVDGRMPFTELARRMQVTEKTIRRRVARLLDAHSIAIVAVADPAALGFDCMAMVLIIVDGSRPPVDIAAELVAVPEIDYVTVTSGPFAIQAEVVCTDKQELHDIAYATIGSAAGVAAVEVLPYLRVHYQQSRFPRPTLNGVGPSPLDDTDRRIIAHLADDGRASFRDFASTMGVSEATVRMRYAKLVESGVVRVTCIVNPLRLGYRYTSWVGVRVGPQARAQDVAAALAGLDAVTSVAITAGRFDVLAEVVTETGESLLFLLDNKIRPIAGATVIDSWMYLTLFHKVVRPRAAGAETVNRSDSQPA